MIVSRLEGSCMTLTINRPERRNALTGSMYQALDQGLQAAQADPACHAVILTGAGDCFTAGNDLSEFQATRSLTDSPALAFLRTLANVDVPVIAAVEGHAVGVGVTLLQHCDFVYAGETAQFSMPFVSLGLCPEGGSSTLLAQLVGARRASDWLLLGRQFDAAEAYESGFITAVSPPGHALNEAQAAADVLGRQPAEALRISKRMLREPGRAELMRTFDKERDLFTERLKSEEAQAAFRLFFDRKSSQS
ncbi:enoyl-CoA hydratase [Pollutimonas subterranea]|uniref:Enoyl-CoA hydratase n=2 Tax=Pollutimonas subterranea TaxID=2045210 RepID=A0A2N4U655_9BURK|nr:enoyl-CoA hydratase [Pollutimonas subterranea]